MAGASAARLRPAGSRRLPFASRLKKHATSDTEGKPKEKAEMRMLFAYDAGNGRMRQVGRAEDFPPPVGDSLHILASIQNPRELPSAASRGRGAGAPA